MFAIAVAPHSNSTSINRSNATVGTALTAASRFERRALIPLLASQLGVDEWQ
jgi:hypothetical protein